MGFLLVGLLAFRRMRRKTSDFAESQTFTGRLPAWVATTESIVWLSLTFLIGGAISWLFAVAHTHLKPNHVVAGTAAIFVVLGTAMIALPIAMLGSNWISWIIPPLKAANLQAMSGLQVSFSTANKGLFKFGIVSVPLGLIALAISVTEPWAR